jgi:hypothetical protein
LGRRDRIKEHIKIHPFVVKDFEFDPLAYDLTVPYTLGLRTLDLSIPFFGDVSPILIRDEYVTMYNDMTSTFEDTLRGLSNEGGIMVTGQSGVGEKCLILEFLETWF